MNLLLSDYGVLEDLHPRLPPPSFVMSDLNPNKMIGLYHHFFHLSGVRIPFSKFLLNVIKKFKVHISQIVPLGLNRVVNFEIFCRALHITPRVVLFRVFYTLCKQGNWFSFSRRRGAPQCFHERWTGLKEWKEHFFLIDRRAIPMAMPWRHRHSCVKFPAPCKGDPLGLLIHHTFEWGGGILFLGAENIRMQEENEDLSCTSLKGLLRMRQVVLFKVKLGRAHATRPSPGLINQSLQSLDTIDDECLLIGRGCICFYLSVVLFCLRSGVEIVVQTRHRSLN
ncbi:hypothetical protein Tco_0819935 [Tanacetum coccineum]|uniref:Transposase (putative) gypsy type domain-containing protein n=1 Tax=Tanacetum coccineum TaxID=301880 RepID=A0ABQ5A8V9_9ASTR